MDMAKKPEFIKGKKNTKKSTKTATELFGTLGIELSERLPTYDVPIELIEPNDWNVNDMDDNTFNRLVQELDETGFIDPIQIAPQKGGKFIIIGGEHRYHGGLALGYDKIPCNILLDDKFADNDIRKLLSVRLNVIKGKTNPEKFTKLYEEMSKKYGAGQLQALFGYTATDAWNKLTKGVEDALEHSGIGGKELRAELKEKTKKVKTVDGLGAVLNKLFKKHGTDLKHSFMVFSYGKKEHLYIIANDKTVSALEHVKSYCRDNDTDINDLVGSALQALVVELNK
jgi:hypothetical protein